ncbi:hypothetical protein BKH42_08490 [Helicobacter sp. 13S00482-2]|uniref:hypothetical protein n=1 Tax=Helicobacter sp. 13S00482-2 TaxID=1476200 RepID=UPI000BA5791D|nr:hypothetical protein [Helicobacter sp. 13S00482-2]PAF52966.1 hypothetical protein BKH42_08490 [Helicobacter sp. 13S00482-2]
MNTEDLKHVKETMALMTQSLHYHSQAIANINNVIANKLDAFADINASLEIIYATIKRMQGQIKNLENTQNHLLDVASGVKHEYEL